MSDPETPVNEAKGIAYRANLEQAAMLLGLIRLLPIEEMLDMIRRADNVGWFLDPTLWRDNHRKMDEDKVMLEALLPAWRLGNKVWNAARESELVR